MNRRTLTLAARNYVFESVGEYVRANRGTGKLFLHRDFGLEFHIVKNCLVIGNDAQLLIPVCRDNEVLILEESFAFDHSDDEMRFILMNNFEDRKIVTLAEAVPLFHLYSNNIWHWILECLPKLLVLEKNGYTGPYIVFNSKFICEILALFEIPKERILFNDVNYFVKNLVVPQKYTYFWLVDHLDIVNFVRTNILERTGTLPGHKRIYIQRTSGRRITNEEAVLDVLRNYDFELVVPQEHSVCDQFRLMTNVDFSVMAHGANVILTLTQKHFSNLIEFFSSAYVVYHATPIVELLELDYTPLTEFRSTPVVLQHQHNAQFCNITVPIKQLEVFLKNAIHRNNKRRSPALQPV